MNRPQLKNAVEEIKNLHTHKDLGYCTYDTEKEYLLQYCNVCKFKELTNCSSHRILEILDLNKE